MKPQSSIFNPTLIRPALLDSLRKLDPRVQWRNPVMFIVWLGSVATTIIAVQQPTGFHIQLTLWLWFTLLFANFAEAIADSASCR